MSRRVRGKRDEDGGLLATTFLTALVLGGAASVLIFNDTERFWWTTVPSVVGAVLFIAAVWWLRNRGVTGGGLGIWLMAARERPEDGLAAAYRPRKVRRGQEVNGPGGAPPTAEQVREIRESSSHTWVPTRARQS